MTLDIPRGRILNVVVIAPGNFLTKRVVPAMALRFNDALDGLLLDSTKAEFADEPTYVFTAAAFGQDAYYEREAYTGPRTQVALEQGTSYRDIDRTVLINKNIRLAKIEHRHVEVGTFNGRVTLRGWVNSPTEKQQINAIAVAAARAEVVDDQITVGKPVTE
jgi:osmotically-inducible protein OsmY